MRRVVGEQIKAVNELGAIVERAGKPYDPAETPATPAAPAPCRTVASRRATQPDPAAARGAATPAPGCACAAPAEPAGDRGLAGCRAFSRAAAMRRWRPSPSTRSTRCRST